MSDRSSERGDRPSKLQKVNQLRRSLPHLTASALASVCKTIREEGVPELTQRKHIAEAARASLEDTGHGPIVEALRLQEGSKRVEVPGVNFWGLLQQAILDPGSSYARYFWKQIALQPPTPMRAWRLALYTDEIVPGNPLAVQTKRKIWACYASFLELGSRALQQEEAWLCVGLLRSSRVAKADAGVSQWVSKILQSIFQRPMYDLRHGAVPLRKPDGGVQLFRLDLSMIVQDGAAHKFLWSCKGDAGTRMCMLCRNVLAQRCSILENSGLPLCGSTETREERLLLSTDASITEAMDKLARKKEELSAVDFQLWQQSAGWNYQPCSILQRQDLRWLVRPVSQFCHDSMHALLVSGVFQTVTWLLLSALQKQFPNVWQIADEYVARWTPPACIEAKARGLLEEARAKACREAEAFKCTASEGLTLSPLLTAFLFQLLRAHPDVEAKAEMECFLELDKLLTCCQRARTENAVSPDHMRDCVHAFLSAVHSAHWQGSMHAKFHWLLHFPGHLAKWGFMVQCFTHERKHKTVKRFANDFYNTRSFEESLLREVLGQELHGLREADGLEPAIRLFEVKQAPRKKAGALRLCVPDLEHAESVRVAQQVQLASGERVSRGDVAQVWALLDLAKGSHALMHSLAPLARESTQGECQVLETLHLVRCEELLAACYWRNLSAGRRQILLPASLRW